MAIALARDGIRLAAVKEKLEANRIGKPLFDAALFARRIEAAFMEMAERHRSGLQPDHIFVRP
jgi:predicted O-linked N-acetylglucosamine transferase (SPINDLY family)